MDGHRKKTGGWTGKLALSLLLLTLLAYWQIIRPLEQHTQLLREQMMTVESNAKNAEKTKPVYSARNELNKFYRDFPVAARWSPQIALLFRTATQEGLILEAGKYRTSTEERDRLTRLEIELPLRGTYVQIRRFIASTMSTIPAATLQRFTAKRNSVNDNLVDADVYFVVYLARSEDE